MFFSSISEHCMSALQSLSTIASGYNCQSINIHDATRVSVSPDVEWRAPYIEFDLQGEQSISAIATKGCEYNSSSCYVKWFTVVYSVNGSDWLDVYENGYEKVFEDLSIMRYLLFINRVYFPYCNILRPRSWNTDRACKVRA